MTEKPEEKAVSIEELLKQQRIESPDKGIYVNHAQFAVSNNEIIIDLYLISPVSPGREEAEVNHMQRILIPHSLGKGFATGLANAIASYEKDTKIKIHDFRGKRENDIIEIWK